MPVTDEDVSADDAQGKSLCFKNFESFFGSHLFSLLLARNNSPLDLLVAGNGEPVVARDTVLTVVTVFTAVVVDAPNSGDAVVGLGYQ